MKTMKKLWTGFLLVWLAIAFVACSSQQGPESDDTQTKTEDVSTAQMAAAPIEAEATIEGETNTYDSDAYFRMTNEVLGDDGEQENLRKIMELEVFYREGQAQGIQISDEMVEAEIDARKSGEQVGEQGENAGAQYRRELTAYLQRHDLSEEDYWSSVTEDVRKYLTAIALVSMVSEEYEGDDAVAYIEGAYTDELFQKYGVSY